MKKVTSLLLLFCVVAFAQQKGTFKDSRDGKTYKTVKIGEQVWMAQNLDYHGDGGKLGLCYGDDPGKKIRKPENCKKYGRLYNWNEAMEACPKNWRLPEDNEWGKLVSYATGTKKLKTKSGWDENRNGTDDYGFSAMPGGSGSHIPVDFYIYGLIDYEGAWWSSSDSDENYAYSREIKDDRDAYWGNGDKRDLLSVRCIQGTTNVSEQIDTYMANNPNLIWYLQSDGSRVRTGGSWFAYDDKAEGGNSSTNFSCNEHSCLWKDRNGKMVLNFSTGSEKYGYYAYAAVGFTWLASGTAAPDVWGTHVGLCVEYALDGFGDFFIKINNKDLLQYNDYKISLPKRPSIGKVFFPFDDFAQKNGRGIQTLDYAKNNSIGITFQGENRMYIRGSATLTLRSISWDSCE